MRSPLASALAGIAKTAPSIPKITSRDFIAANIRAHANILPRLASTSRVRAPGLVGDVARSGIALFEFSQCLRGVVDHALGDHWLLPVVTKRADPPIGRG